MTDGEFHHERHHDGDVQVQVPELEECTLSFVGREGTETVTCYAFDLDEQKPAFPLFEVKKDGFETLLEQASGALMNANGDYPQRPELERDSA